MRKLQKARAIFRRSRTIRRMASTRRRKPPGFRRWPVGAEILPRGGVHFRIWGPELHQLTLVLEGSDLPMIAEPGGYHSLLAPDARAGDRYWFRVGPDLLADPASRFQPDGPEAPSEIVDPSTFAWTDSGWKGPALRGSVLYEMHVGTFTAQGTWRAAMERLPALADLGVTALEVMPVAEFPGRFGWGYDGVHPFAPTRLYGRPDDFKAFVDRAHALGLAVILDVVYNHLGPDGCVFRRFSRGYFSTIYRNEWGDPMNFDGPDSGPVREFFVANAAYWIEEFHLDGLRLDATQSLHDASAVHIIAEIERTVRRSGRGRSTLLVSENEPQKTQMVRPRGQGGFGLDGLWNDDFHHSAIVALTGRNEAYYSDHRGAPQEFISATKYGCLFQGQRYAWQRQGRGTSTHGLPPETFILFIENHDQLANSGGGLRLHQRTSPGRMRAMTALMLLMPGTPMLFQGQEFGSSRPFLYFADHKPDLARNVEQGRNSFLAQFPSLASPEMRLHLTAPHDPATFERCRLEWSEFESHPEIVALHRDLLRLRREETAFGLQRPGAVDGAVLGPDAFVLRFQTDRDADLRLLIVNFGSDLAEASFAEPLLAPPEGTSWGILWSSEDPRYGGTGTPPVSGDDGWRLPGHAAVVLAPETKHEGPGKSGA